MARYKKLTEVPREENWGEHTPEDKKNVIVIDNGEVKQLDSSAIGGGSGSQYSAGDGINISNNTISAKVDNETIGINSTTKKLEVIANYVSSDDVSELNLYTSSDVTTEEDTSDTDAITSKAVQTMFTKELPGPIVLSIDPDFWILMTGFQTKGQVPFAWSGEQSYEVGDVVNRVVSGNTKYYVCQTAYTPTPGTTSWNSYSSNFSTAKDAITGISINDYRPYLTALQKGIVRGAYYDSTEKAYTYFDETAFCTFSEQNILYISYRYLYRGIAYRFNIMFNLDDGAYTGTRMSTLFPFTGA